MKVVQLDGVDNPQLMVLFLEHQVFETPFTTASSATGIPQVLDALGIAPDELYEWKPYDSVGEFFRTGHVLVIISM